MEAVGIEPHFLAGVLKPDCRRILGHKLPFPIIVPPMGAWLRMCPRKWDRPGCRRGEDLDDPFHAIERAPRRGGDGQSGRNGCSLFPADRGYAREVIMRAKAAGYTAIVPTIDSTLAYPRDNNIRNDFRIPISLGSNAPLNERDPVKAAQMMSVRKVDLNWDDMLWIKQETGLPVVLKGVERPDDAERALSVGCDGVVVSNHGGRALDGVPAAITVLPRIADAVKGRVPIIFDSGIRRGQDVFRALALGADVVACGRPILYGLALGGHLGAQSVLEYLRDDLYIVMQLTGTPNIKSITRDHIAPARIA